MHTFPLFGIDVAIPIELANFNVFREKYFKLAKNAANTLAAQYKQEINNIEQLVNEYLTLYDKQLLTLSSVAVNDLATNKILDIDLDRFLEKLEKNTKTIRVFESIEEQYDDICEDQAEKSANRTARRKNRSKWHSYGYGLQGAIKGAATTGALNLGSGLMHGTANVIGGAFSAAGAGIKKMALFNDSNTFNSLMAAAQYDFSLVLLILTEMLKKKISIKAVTSKDADTSNIMFKNVSTASFSEDELLKTMVEILLLNPYEEKFYTFLLTEFGDEANEVNALAEFFHIDIGKLKEALVRKLYENSPVATLEQAYEARDNVVTFCKLLGGISNPVEQDIADLIETRKYEKVYKEYATYTKTSLDEWKLCREKIDARCKELGVIDNGEKILSEIDKEIFDFKVALAKALLTSLPTVEEDDAIAAKQRLEVYCDEIQLTRDNPVILEIDTIIKKIDQNIRTVEGYEFGTRDEAARANVEKKAVDDLFDGRAPVSRLEHLQLLSYLDTTAVMSEMAQIYRDRSNKAIARIDKLAKRARTFEIRKTTRFHLTSGNKNGTIISAVIYAVLFILSFFAAPVGCVIALVAIVASEFVKRQREKSAWNELTHSGQYELAAVLAVKTIESKVI